MGQIDLKSQTEPGWFNFSPVAGAGGSMTYTSVTYNAVKFKSTDRRTAEAD